MDFYGTIGPACAQPAILQHMVEAGMTGIRMNLSHGPLAAHTDWLAMIRAAGMTRAKRVMWSTSLEKMEAVWRLPCSATTASSTACSKLWQRTMGSIFKNSAY